MTKMISEKDREGSKKQPFVNPEKRIVAIGASAGGLEALKEFFDNVPPDCLFSFVIVQHLSPDYKSLMAELLSKNTALPIHEIKSNMSVDPGSIYLIPPKKNLTIINGKLLLVDKPKGSELNLPIDIFFRSLAQEAGDKATCIILSGTGSDGTSGARAIKEAGGMVMVQSPEQAKFDGMPKSAINTGLVDYVLPVENLPLELIHFVNHPQSNGEKEHELTNDEQTVNSILAEIRMNTKLNFDHYKRPTLVRRIARRISVNKLHNQQEYLSFVKEHPSELLVLSREFLIGVTKFFRDGYVWDSLKENVLPELIRNKKSEEIIKVWCVGTSTGEEAYTLAMLISEELEKQGRKNDVKIFATDLAAEHLEIGSKGVYPESIIADLSQKRLEKFFFRLGDEYKVKDSLRKMVIFSQHDILKDPPFNKMDIAICRNLLIYMQGIAQRKIIGLLHYSLNLNGTLLLGSSESLGDYKSVMDEIDRKSKLYRNIKSARTIGLEPLNFSDRQKLAPIVVASPKRMKAETLMADIMNQTVADELGMAAVYIDQNYKILHAIGEFKKYIELPEKGFSTNLLKMLPENISISMGIAVRKALSSQEKTLYKNMRFSTKPEKLVIDLMVSPFHLDHSTKPSACLLLFIPKENVSIGSAEVIEELKGLDKVHINELEDELRETRNALKTVIQEVETSNEELQTTNEELLAANEELQSTNEELQSVNEELHTVNAELQEKIEDLAGLNSDMDNLLTSTDIGTIFLDRDLRIRKFTPAVKDHFSLRNSDIGRFIYDFSSSFGGGSKTFDRIREVMETGVSYQREIKGKNEKWFLKMVTPYLNNQEKIDGAVLSFVDIENLKNTESTLRKSEQEFRILYNNAPDMFISFDVDGYIINGNDRMVRKLGYEHLEEMKGLHLKDLYLIEDSDKVEERLKEYKKTGKMINVERNLRKKDGSSIPVSVNSEYVYNETGEPIYSMASFRDISDILEMQQKFKSKSNAFEQLLEGTIPGYWDWIVEENKGYLSPSFKRMFGYEDKDQQNESWLDLVHPDDLKIVKTGLEKHIKSKGKVPFDYQIRSYHKDGHIMYVYCRGKVIEWDKNGKAVRMVGSHVDITAIEEELFAKNRELEQFAYVASHDLQEPLNTITDFVSLFEKEYKGKLDPDADQYLEFIIEAAVRMKSLVKGVLDYSRVGGSQNIQIINLDEVINTVKEDLGKRIKESGTKFTIDPLPEIKGYHTEIHSLFLNLISNSIKFRRENVKPRIKISYSQDDTFWNFAIQDNGIGIDDRHTDKVFNIFQRLNNMDSYEGTGIGLAQCKKIVELHHGHIWLDSKLNKGTTFHFTIKKI